MNMSAFTSRTKSLREKFASKRSYSESFKDPVVTSPRRDPSKPRPSCPVALPEPARLASTGNLRLNALQDEAPFNPYATLPTDTYCSALDINSEQDDPRFPWQRDAAIQCDISPSEDSPMLLHPRTRAERKKSQSAMSLRLSPQEPFFTKPGVPLMKVTDESMPEKTPPVKVFQQKKGSVLQRAMSLERGRSRQKLKHQVSMDDARAGPQLYVPHYVKTLTPSLESQSSIECPLIKESANNSAPNSRNATPPSEGVPDISQQSPFNRKASERRKMCFLRKQTNSAPDSFEDSATTPTTPERLPIGYYNFDSMQRLLDLSLTAAASSKAKLDNRTFLLSIPTPSGLNSQRDGKSYLNLPSPNLQQEEGEGNVFKKLSATEDDGSEQEEIAECPPVSALHRRRALVPPKMVTDGYESATDELERSPSLSDDCRLSVDSGSTRSSRRRSSIVVIPPMQICPGDLLVYSKVLTHRNTLFELDGSTQSLSLTEDASRKNKNSWSLLKLFDRSNRSKSESLCGLEEMLSNLQPCDAPDEHLTKFKGMQWNDFVAHCEEQKQLHLQHQLSQPSTSSNRKMPTHSTWVTFSEDSPPGNVIRHSSADSDPTLGSPRQSPLSSFPLHERHSTDLGKINLDAVEIESESVNSKPVLDRDQSDDKMLDDIESQINTWWTHTVSKNEQKRRDALWDLFQSECMFYEEHLIVLKNVFMEPLKKIQVEGFAMFAEPEVLFGNLDELCCVTYAFCKEFLNLLLQRVNANEVDTTEILVRLFKKSSKATALTQAYHRYTLNYINALNYLETLRRQVEFNEFEKWCSRDSRCKKLQLTDLLVSPVQHIMRVPLILKDIEIRTEDPEGQKAIASILEAEEHSLRELDDKMKWLKNFERLLEIQRNIVWPAVSELDPKAYIPDFLKTLLSKQPCERLIVSPRRQIVLEGGLHLLDSGKSIEMYVILFDDMLLITRRKKGLHKKKSSITDNWASSCSKGNSEAGYKYVVYKQPLSLDRFFIHDVSVQDSCANNLKNAFVLVCLNRFQQIITIHTFQATNETLKSSWLSKLRDTMDRWKRTLQSTVFRNQRTSK